jgi:hypothetical protein
MIYHHAQQQIHQQLLPILHPKQPPDSQNQKEETVHPGIHNTNFVSHLFKTQYKSEMYGTTKKKTANASKRKVTMP